RRLLAFTALPPVQLKGKAGVMRVYRPAGLAQSTERAGTTMVGRQAEFARLVAAVGEAQAGLPHVLLIEGEAGMGKSRLLDELAFARQARGFTGLAGAGQSSERQTPYRAWR